MGCFTSFGTNQFQNGGTYPVQYVSYPNPNQYIVNQNNNPQEQKQEPKPVIPKPIIKLPDPKLFEFDPNFLKDCEKIEKRPFDGGEIEGQIVNNEFNGKGRIHFDNGDIYEGELKNGSAH